MVKNRQITIHQRRKEIAKKILAISCILLAVWITPTLAALLRPSLPQPSFSKGNRHAQSDVDEALKQYGFNENTIASLRQLKNKNQDGIIYPRLEVTAPLSIADADPTLVKDWGEIRSLLNDGVYGSYGKSELNQSTMYAIGHSSDYNIFNKYSSVFASLGQSQPGDYFVILKDRHLTFYQVIDNKIINPNDIEQFVTFGEPFVANREQAILVTCWPILTTRSRLLVRGVSESTIHLNESF